VQRALGQVFERGAINTASSAGQRTSHGKIRPTRIANPAKRWPLSTGVAGNPLTELVASLSATIRVATACGDFATAQATADTLTRVLADPTAAPVSPVIGLAGRRRGER